MAFLTAEHGSRVLGLQKLQYMGSGCRVYSTGSIVVASLLSGMWDPPGWSLVSQSCLTLCDSMDYSPLCSSVHGISQGKNIGVGCHFLLQGIFPPRDWTCISCIAGKFFTTGPTGKPREEHLCVHQNHSRMFIAATQFVIATSWKLLNVPEQCNKVQK